MTAGIRLSLAAVEGLHLAGLLDEFTSLLQDAIEEADPALDRLTPQAYPGDAAASAEFAAGTRDDLLDRRAADAAVVRHALDDLVEDFASDRAADGSDPREILIPIREIDSWLRTLTALRLVIADRLGITADDAGRQNTTTSPVDAHDPDDPRFGVYDWLGYRLDGLIERADEAERADDAEPDR